MKRVNMKKTIMVLILIILSPCILLSGCKNSKESNETPEEDLNIKNSNLLNYDEYRASQADPNERIKSGPLKRGDATNPYFLYGEITPLMQSREPEITELLIKYGARVNEQDIYGRTALMISACFDGYNEEDNLNARILIKNGADMNIKDNRGQTALYIAIISGNDASLKLLVDNGADVNLRDNRGLSPLMAVNIIFLGRWRYGLEILEEITKILVKAGAVMNDDDKQRIERIIDKEEIMDFSMKEMLYISGGDDCR